MSRLFLGIDTSNYTTSVAVCDEHGNIHCDERKAVQVKKGMRGLRQSEVFFQHCLALPELFERIAEQTDMGSVCAAGVSSIPRNVEGSYMPVFRCGESFARVFALSRNLPLYRFSHQEGHVKAIRPEIHPGDSFLAFHLSGGTTEILHVGYCQEEESFMNIDIMGKTLDISAGQLIDRVGVAMGTDFPAGYHLDAAACRKRDGIKAGSCTVPELKIKPFALKGLDINLSGAETHLVRNIEKYSREDIAYVLFSELERVLRKLLKKCREKYPDIPVVFAGGVSQSRFIRDALGNLVEFGDYGSDNAAGTALLAKDRYMNGIKENENGCETC